jgi:hypothetical protein
MEILRLRRRSGVWALGLACGLWCAGAGLAWAAKPVPDTEEIDGTLAHPWVFLPPKRSPEAYFTNVQNPVTVASPFVLRFGLSMRGLVPAGHNAGLAGHHHLLINQPLPLDFTKALPFTEKYIHFGKGQMETALDLPPGAYDLRLVLADQGHIPYFVYSKTLHVTVTAQNKDVPAASVLGPPRVEIMGLADGAAVQPPFRIQFHASGYNIAPKATRLPDTHYFRLVLERSGAAPEVLGFSSGQTEVWLNPPKGAYTARLELVRNATQPETVAAHATPVAFSVGP